MRKMRFSNLAPGDYFILRDFIDDALGNLLIRKIKTRVSRKFEKFGGRANIKFVGKKDDFSLMREGAKVIRVLV